VKKRAASQGVAGTTLSTAACERAWALQRSALLTMEYLNTWFGESDGPEAPMPVPRSAVSALRRLLQDASDGDGVVTDSRVGGPAYEVAAHVLGRTPSIEGLGKAELIEQRLGCYEALLNTLLVDPAALDLGGALHETAWEFHAFLSELLVVGREAAPVLHPRCM